MNALLTGALHAFGLSVEKAQFIQHHENAIYRVNGNYLLRIHKAADGLHADHDPDKRHAELALLHHLADKGLPVQRPIGEATLPDGTTATLMTWLEGHHITEDEFTADMQRRIGALTAQLHLAAADFQHTSLRRYDAAHVHQLKSAIGGIALRHHLNMKEIEIVCQAAGVIESRLANAADALVAIHCDLSRSNILLTEQGLSPIDFSLCGMGHPMHDLGILMGNTSTQAQRLGFAQGYTAAGGCIDLPLLDAGYALGWMEALVFHADVWPRESWFAPRLTRWINEMLRPLAEGKPLLNENMYLVNLK